MHTPPACWPSVRPSGKTTTTKRGQVRYWFFSNRAFRAFQMPRAEAELMLATEAAVLVTKPEWVGR